MTGPSNEADVIVKGVQSTTAFDSGAQVSTVTKGFCRQLGLNIYKMKRMIHLEAKRGIEHFLFRVHQIYNWNTNSRAIQGECIDVGHSRHPLH